MKLPKFLLACSVVRLAFGTNMSTAYITRFVPRSKPLLFSVAGSLLFVLSFALYSSRTICLAPTPAPVKPNVEFMSGLSKFNGYHKDNQSSGDKMQPIIASASYPDLQSGIVGPPNREVHVFGIVSQSEQRKNIGEDGGLAETQVRKSERQRLFPCNDFKQVSYLGQRGSFWVFYNFVTPSLHFSCDESVTYTTHADHTYLDNLIPLLERWLGPVSLSLYTPGTDYYDTLLRIHYLRECSSLVRDFVSFHLFFENKQIPQSLSKNAREDLAKMPKVNCSRARKFGPNVSTFRKSRNLTYSVNVGRNVAHELASTHYVLASDIELYPSPNLIQSFLEMIKRDGSKLLQGGHPKVFVLPLFEVNATVSVLPYDKLELQKMLKENIAHPFRENLCPKCFTNPKQEKWLKAKVTEGLHVFTVGKREGHQNHWEPIYIGTKSDPIYDERLTWEGRNDKMVQGYILCLLDYEFHILDNAFLVHRPGIKTRLKYVENTAMKRQKEVMKKTIVPELNLLYGRRPECII